MNSPCTNIRILMNWPLQVFFHQSHLALMSQLGMTLHFIGFCFLHKISHWFNKSYIHPTVRIIFVFSYLHCHCLTSKVPTLKYGIQDSFNLIPRCHIQAICHYVSYFLTSMPLLTISLICNSSHSSPCLWNPTFPLRHLSYYTLSILFTQPKIIISFQQIKP